MKTTNVERALKCQRQRREQGLCVVCGIPAVNEWHCAVHKEKAAERSRNNYRLKHGIPLEACDQRFKNRFGEQTMSLLERLKKIFKVVSLTAKQIKNLL